MTKFSMCMQSFRSIDNQLAKLRRGGRYSPPPPPEREGVEKYHLRERVKFVLHGTSLRSHFELRLDEKGINKILYCFVVVSCLLKNFLLSVELWYWSCLGKLPFFS